MKKLLIGGLLFLVGCSNYVGAHEWVAAEKICSARGGVRGVSASPAAYVQCNNLEKISIYG